MGTENDEYRIRLPPRWPTKGQALHNWASLAFTHSPSHPNPATNIMMKNMITITMKNMITMIIMIILTMIMRLIIFYLLSEW